MLIDTCVTIAYKCPSCGSFQFINASIFSLHEGKSESFFCRCGGSCLTVYRAREEYCIEIPCIGCGNNHEFQISRKTLLSRELSAFYCPSTGLSQCFAGKDESVRQRVDHLERELDEIIDTFGYESYFKNPRVMLDSLNRIHDLAEEKKLYCECGSRNIELTLFSDLIHLKCKKCSVRKIIKAATNTDLKDTLSKQQIVLMEELEAGDAGGGSSLIRSTDGK